MKKEAINLKKSKEWENFEGGKRRTDVIIISKIKSREKENLKS